MPDLDLPTLLGPELAGALAQRGFTELTAVQEAVLDPALADRDLRVTSQTGSGKTVALGLAIRHIIQGETASVSGAARPRAMVVAPTRELAHQVEQELSWLYAPLGIKVVTTTGGSSARDERRALGTGPGVIVGTPGRLLDHLSRRSIDASQVGAVVLDEADRMLDLGFREDLTAILGFPPKEHRTHLVSATFPHVVKALADSVQNNPAHVEGTRLGAAHADIAHRIVLVDSKERLGAVINILLSHPDEQALVFARTRADVASLTRELVAAKFSVGMLSGEMDQVARNRAMSAFKTGSLRVLVATDVAARGIDVQDIAHVIHADAPSDADTYTHRSGRTGRAGRKGTSSVLVTPSGLRAAGFLLGRAGVAFKVEPVPSADEIRKASDERLFTDLTADVAEGTTESVPPRLSALAERLAAGPEVVRTLTRLLARVRGAEACEPRDLRRIEPPPPDRPRSNDRPRPNDGPRSYDRGRPSELPRAPTPGRPLPRPSRDHSQPFGPSTSERPIRSAKHDDGRVWVSFRVTWGADKGADARRLLAIVCRRGGISGSDVGAIRVGNVTSTVNVAADVAREFGEAAGISDPREPNVRIHADQSPGEPEFSPAAPSRRSAPRHDAPRDDERPPRAPRDDAPQAPRDEAPRPFKKPAYAGSHYKPSTGPRPRPASPAGFKGDAYKPTGAPRPKSDKPGGGGGSGGGGYKGKRDGTAPPKKSGYPKRAK